MISKEKIFKYKELAVKYRFKAQSTDRNHLFVIFSGFGAKGKETTYTFAGESALHIRGNILWIKDDFYGGATYYM